MQEPGRTQPGQNPVRAHLGHSLEVFPEVQVVHHLALELRAGQGGQRTQGPHGGYVPGGQGFTEAAAHLRAGLHMNHGVSWQVRRSTEERLMERAWHAESPRWLCPRAGAAPHLRAGLRTARTQFSCSWRCRSIERLKDGEMKGHRHTVAPWYIYIYIYHIYIYTHTAAPWNIYIPHGATVYIYSVI